MFQDLRYVGATGTDVHDVGHKTVSPPYFATVHVSLLAGRGFNAHDREGFEQVA